MLRQILAGLTAVFISSSPYAASADECDPAKFLKYDEIKSSKDIETHLIFLDYFKNSSVDKNEFKGSFGYDGIGIDHDGVREVANELNKQLKLDFSEKEKSWYTISKLSDTGKSAYSDCLKNRKENFSIIFSSDATRNDQFFVIVRSHPQEDVGRNQHIDVSAIHAKVLSADRSVKIWKDALIKIQRDIDQPTEISVRVGDKINIISFPPRPKRLVIESKTSGNPVAGSLWGGQTDIVKTLCVELAETDRSAAILKNTLQVRTNLDRADNGVLTELNPEQNRKYSPRSACTTVYWHLRVDTGRVTGTAQAVALVARAIDDK